MKKVLLGIFAGIFILPHICESYALMEAKIDKKHANTSVLGKNESRPDSISMDYDDLTGTITIATTAEKTKEVEIEIYKDGELIYEDRDKVNSSSSVNYTMTDEESGEYDVHVKVDGTSDINETITI